MGNKKASYYANRVGKRSKGRRGFQGNKNNETANVVDETVRTVNNTVNNTVNDSTVNNNVNAQVNNPGELIMTVGGSGSADAEKPAAEMSTPTT